MRSGELLAAFDAQLRRNPSGAPEGSVEREPGILRVVAAEEAWVGVLWSDLRGLDADAVIAAQIERFEPLGCEWEWKHYSYDEPPDLRERLLAAGFRAEPVEALMAAPIDELDLSARVPDGFELVEVRGQSEVRALTRVYDEVFGGENSGMGPTLLQGIAAGTSVAFVVMAGGEGVAGGRLELHAGTDFVSLWGDATVPALRRRGLFRALVARRAALAAERGFPLLQLDAADASQPTFARLGLRELALTTPYKRAPVNRELIG